MKKDKKTNTNENLTPEKAKDLLNKKAQEDVERCKEELNTCLNKYDCMFDIAMVIRAGSNTPILDVTKRKQ